MARNNLITLCSKIKQLPRRRDSSEPAEWSDARRRSCQETCRRSWCDRGHRHTIHHHSDASQWRGHLHAAPARRGDVVRNRTTHGACTVQARRLATYDVYRMFSSDVVRCHTSYKCRERNILHRCTVLVKEERKQTFLRRQSSQFPAPLRLRCLRKSRLGWYGHADFKICLLVYKFLHTTTLHCASRLLSATSKRYHLPVVKL